ncbi:[protein-PII] uridylyltransferase [Burkholderiaceae bacterium FT117]|uniref:[protein-PII] uridylyltransferase n=1 Tax=Zeimonas sediminis TaxID=2944268 RepID=UPI0023431454|nr:[protein-PII] uridylyltransferase [Zeimonas sediminis]MCM5569182.1 [protein-PII] uridylyltransferase [Zeimonas sediminis]
MGAGALGAVAAEAAPLPDLAPLREAWQRERAAAIQGFRDSQNPDRLQRALSRATDRALRALWRMLSPSRQYSLVAVGGYGRGEQFPHSDVDLLILTPERPQGAAAERLERFVGACWDLGLEIGHAVRTPDECLREAAGDVTVRTSLLERRRLAGNRLRYEALGRELDAALRADEFFSAKMLEMRQRHAKYVDSPYSLEPNTKESPGGLRDLQVIRWIARASGFGRNWSELEARGLITASEAIQLRANERRIARIRAWLHILAGRREDRLVFDLQARAAEAMGLARSSARQSSEELMQRYYRAAKTVTQLNTIVLQNLRGALFPSGAAAARPIDREFLDRQGLLDLADPGLFERDPSAILRCFLTMQRHPELTGIATRTLRALWHARGRIDARFRRDPANRALFLELLKSPRGVTHELRRMNKWSILGRYLPAFRRIVGRMQHDLFHVYTVDQHILMVVRNLRRFAMAEHAHEYPFCSQLLAAFEKPWLLTIAALFHDIAKGRGGDHSKLGRVDARRFCRQHGLERADSQLVEFLVEHHLTMSSVAQKQDLGDPAVITRFASLVGTEERLTALYLLTVADIRGTSPKVWNAWKAKLLEDLFRATKRALEGETPTRERRLDARRAEAVRLLNLRAIPPERYEAFWKRLGMGYFLRNDAQDIAWHARVLTGHPEDRPVVRTRVAPIGEGFQVVVWLRDQPDLFARLCGYFDSRNLSVLDAKIHTTRDGWALDSFLVVDPVGEVGQYRDILTLVETELGERLERRAPLPVPVRGRSSRRSRTFPIEPSVDLRPDERGDHFLLSITANDRTGLLYAIAQVLSRHGISLETARITTLGERVEDVFLIEGPALLNPRQQLQFETDLLDALRA